MGVVAFVTLVVVGFTACAEFGSWAFVHPVLWRLPKDHHLAVEQGLLRTFGRVMPVLMPGSLALAIWYASITTSGVFLAWLGAGALAIALISTVIANVPINIRTGRLDLSIGEAEWRQLRRRWEWFQGLRSCLLLAGFILLCASVTVGRPA
jgi:hypothetical protein